MKNSFITQITIIKLINFRCRDTLCLISKILISLQIQPVQRSIKNMFDQFTKSLNQVSLQIDI